MDSIQKPGFIDFKQLYCIEVQGWQEEDFRPEGPGLAFQWLGPTSSKVSLPKCDKIDPE